MLKIDWNVLWMAINLVVWYILIKLFLFKPINKIIDARKDAINGKLNEAELAKKDAYALKEKYDVALNDVKLEGESITKKAMADADAEYKRVIAEAGKEAEEIVEKAKEKAKEEHLKMIKESDAEIAKLVVEATGKLIGNNKEVTSDLYDKFITKEGERNEP